LSTGRSHKQIFVTARALRPAVDPLAIDQVLSRGVSGYRDARGCDERSACAGLDEPASRDLDIIESLASKIATSQNAPLLREWD
jgi:hypothetical protein